MHLRRRMLAGCVPGSVAVVTMAFACSAMASLPDNRAYEMVSPIEKGGLSVLPNLAVTDAAGEHVIVDGGSENALLSSSVSWMLETRTPTGWSGVQIGPGPTPGAEEREQGEVSLNAVSEDLSSFAFQSRMQLDPRDTTHGMGEYVRNGPTGPLTWATGPPAPAVPVSEPGECQEGLEPVHCFTNRAVFAGASANLQHVVWSQYHPLLTPPASLPGYPADTHEQGYEVYESVGGVDQLAGLVPAGQGRECGGSNGSCVVPPCGAAMGNQDALSRERGFAPVQGAVSGKGSQVIFTSPDPSTGCAPAGVYVREADSGTTVQVSATQRKEADPNGPKDRVYAGASEEGGLINTVFFASKEDLTDDANTGSEDQGNDLYAYDLRSEKLTDISADSNLEDPNGASVESFIGSSTNGSLVYFMAASVLATEPNSHGQTAQPGVSNLYVYDATTRHTTFIAPGTGLKPPHMGLLYAPRNSPGEGRLTSEITPDGRHLLFTSSERLTEYNNFGPECTGEGSSAGPQRHPAPCGEVYLYTVADNSLVCMSCNPSGAPPAGSARLPERFVEAPAFNILEPGTLPAPKAISDDGSRVFFSSPDKLTGEPPAPTTTIGSAVPMALNWEFEPNVYEYEAGSVHLIAPAAVLLATTPSGRDVLFDTLSQLAPQDTDGLPDVYDARVGGGFPVLAPPACSGMSCQGAPAPAPVFATPAGVTFHGVGNFPPPAPAKATTKPKPKACKKGLVRRRVKKHSRCVRRPRAKKSAKGRN